METVLQGMDWKFSRNMTVVRDGERLVVVNSVRLTDEGMAALDKLGKVTDVVRLGSLHGRDDPFYVDRYGAEYWMMPGMEHETGLKATQTLSPDSASPISGASVLNSKPLSCPRESFVSTVKAAFSSPVMHYRTGSAPMSFLRLFT
ncbi:hypothetical protein [Candidatus Reidiella endopervernicosa]|uniref:hypothetical protein n=1 Tax=Candidatus Reidiella endopervernicosa TaxID=2738883 RepID=UPI001F217FFC|nr:hypothetical protein [Candidatus Reidiella endopervernicosa]